MNSFKILQYIFRAAELSSAIDVQVDYQQIVPVQERKVSWIVIICTLIYCEKNHYMYMQGFRLGQFLGH